MEWCEKNEMRWEIKRSSREVRLVKTSEEREERLLEERPEREGERGMKKQGSGWMRLFKICQGSETIKHTIIKRLNGV